MFKSFTKTITPEDKKNAIYKHLYEMNISLVIKSNAQLTDYWKGACYALAGKDLNDLIKNNQVDEYFRRMVKNTI